MRLLKAVSLFQLATQALATTPAIPSYSTDGTNIDEIQQMTFDLGFGPEVFDAYVQPNITTFTQGTIEHPKKPQHNGHAVKFFNMSPEPILLYWDDGGQRQIVMGRVKPFGVSGTASFPGHRFFLAPLDYVEGSNEGILRRFYVDSDHEMHINYFYDPYYVEGDDRATDENLMALSYANLEKYNIVRRTQKFDKYYREFTGRSYLSMFPRDKPRHFMWPADFYGQEHWFTTRETHFESIPSQEDIQPIRDSRSKRVLKDDDERLLSQYRTGDSFLNLTFTVVSCAPRVYEIENFLSNAEVDHILNIAHGTDLKPSSTGTADGISGSEKKTKTRTSLNTWVGRETDQVIDAIYRRSADLMRIDEAYFRYRDEHEVPDLDSLRSVAEQLQLVHYDVGQEYTAHHDFGYSPAGDKAQGARYATLLFYLNEPEKGGETEFPRWFNGETTDGLLVTPKTGKAVLFYSQLPDGNMDDLSQHAAKPIKIGEKYLINLWVRDPKFED